MNQSSYPSMEAEELIQRLNLLPHPEGGRYREIFRSAQSVETGDGRGRRSAFTLIHFLLGDGEESAWHQVLSDESWHWSAGSDLRLFLRDPDFSNPREVTIGNPLHGHDPVAVVPAGHWQSARSSGKWTLVQCGVAPGFDFADFRLRDA